MLELPAGGEEDKSLLRGREFDAETRIVEESSRETRRVKEWMKECEELNLLDDALKITGLLDCYLR